MVLLTLLFALFSAASGAAALQLTITNNCPTAIPIFINGAAQTTAADRAADYPSVPPGHSIVRTYEDTWSGLVYTNGNAPGSPGNSGVGTTRVGFINQPGYYYIVKDPQEFNTGVQVLPDTPAHDGFCTRLTCNSRYCANALLKPVVDYPAPGPSAPTPPFWRCPGTAGFTVRFCPTGGFPRTDGTMQLHPNGAEALCLESAEGAQSGSGLHIAPCVDAQAAQRWRFLGDPAGSSGAQLEPADRKSVV